MKCIILDEILFALFVSEKNLCASFNEEVYIYIHISIAIAVSIHVSANPAWGQSSQAHSSHYASLKHLGEGSCLVVWANSYVGFFPVYARYNAEHQGRWTPSDNQEAQEHQKLKHLRTTVLKKAKGMLFRLRKPH